MSLKQLSKAVLKLANPTKAKQMQKFFKTGQGEYAQGDKFLGLTNPQSRQIAQEHKTLSFPELKQLIQSEIHQQRFIALVILCHRFKNQKERQKCFDFYLQNIQYVNNWDLVDVSCYKIVGQFLLENKERVGVLEELAVSGLLWRKRVAMVSTLAFIKDGQNQITYKIAQILLEDKHDLIHKAVGWMLRQTGKNSNKQLKQFLQKHYDKIPRTCLRYAIQRFPEEERQQYLRKQY